ncbi:hypothetical protein H6761_01730 [Candidatus Nomurabacteria bacterium]|nr:hypothetical protein [Candidatus Nomurabacteria bacterium]
MGDKQSRHLREKRNGENIPGAIDPERIDALLAQDRQENLTAGAETEARPDQVLQVAQETEQKVDQNVDEFKAEVKDPSLRLEAEQAGKSTKELVDNLAHAVFGKEADFDADQERLAEELDRLERAIKDSNLLAESKREDLLKQINDPHFFDDSAAVEEKMQNIGREFLAAIEKAAEPILRGDFRKFRASGVDEEILKKAQDKLASNLSGLKRLKAAEIEDVVDKFPKFLAALRPDSAVTGTNPVDQEASKIVGQKPVSPVVEVPEDLRRLDFSLEEFERGLGERSGAMMEVIINIPTEFKFQGIENFDPEKEGAMEEFGTDELVKVDSAFVKGLPGMESFLMPKDFAAKVVDLMIMGDGQVEFDAKEHLDGIVDAVNQLMGNELTELSGELQLGLRNEVRPAALITSAEIKDAYKGWKKVKFEVKIEGQEPFVIWKLLSPDLVAKLEPKEVDSNIDDAPEAAEEEAPDSVPTAGVYDRMRFAYDERLFAKIVNDQLTNPGGWKFGDPIESMSDYVIQVELINAVRRVMIKIIEGEELSELEQKIATAYPDFVFNDRGMDTNTTNEKVYTIQEALDHRNREAATTAASDSADGQVAEGAEQVETQVESNNEQTKLITKAAKELDQTFAELRADDYGNKAEQAAGLVAAKIAEIKALDQNLTIAELNQRIGEINQALDQKLELLRDNDQEKQPVNDEMVKLFEDYEEYINHYEDGQKHPEIQAKFLDEISSLDRSLPREELEDKLDDIIARFSQEIEKAAEGATEEDSEESHRTEEGVEEVIDGGISEEIENESYEDVVPGNLDELRSAFVKALYKRGQVVRGGKSKFEKIAQAYQEAKDKHVHDSLENKKGELLQDFTEGKITIEQLKNILASEYISLLQAEEVAIDAEASGLDKNFIGKFKEFWRKTGKIRLGLGVGLFGASLLFSGGTTGVVAGILTARGVMSSTGTFMFAEATIDKRSEWGGQKGLIDKMKNLGFKSKKSEAGKITDEDIVEWREVLGNQEQYPTEELAKELARLRILSLDKRVGLAEAGRFGDEQAAFVNLIQEEYFRRLKSEFQDKIALDEIIGEPIVNGNERINSVKIDIVSETLKTEQKTVETLSSAQDKSRMKAMRRYGVSAVLGLTVGAIAGSRVLDKLSHADGADQVQGAAEHAQEVADPGAPETAYLRPTLESDAPVPHGVAENIPDQGGISVEAVVSKGDNVWNLTEDQLRARVPNWNNLNEAQRTYFIDYFKDKIVADPKAFGIDGDVDQLKLGTKLNFGNLFNPENISEAAQKSGALTAEQMQNIVANNEAIAEAAKHGVRISTESVDQIAAEVRAHGTDWLSHDGEVHNWSFDHQPVEQVEINGQTIYRLADNHDVTVDDLSKMVDHSGHNFVPETTGSAEVATANLDGFLAGKTPYSEELLRAVENNPQEIDALVNHVFESSPEVQRQFLEDYYPNSFTPDSNKAAIFLKYVEQAPNVKISDLNDLETVERYTSAFDKVATSDSLPGKAWEARLVKDENGRQFYAFVHLVKKHLFGQEEYMLDDLSGNTWTLKEKVLESWLDNSVLSEPVKTAAKAASENLPPVADNIPEPKASGLSESLDQARKARETAGAMEPESFETPIEEPVEPVSAEAIPEQVPVSENVAEAAQTSTEIAGEVHRGFDQLSQMNDGATFTDTEGNTFVKEAGKLFRLDPLGDPTIEVRNQVDLDNLYKK